MAAPPDRLTHALADRYTLERELGAGGMATVYLAHDLRHDRKVAIKVLRPELAAVIGAERFLVEIRTTANLQHPHILPLHDSGMVVSREGREGGAGEPADLAALATSVTFLYYVMPYIEGISLRDRIVREHQLPVAESVRIAREVAAALDYAHRRGVIHRDIKPENILLHDGSALVADFGIALAMSSAGSRMTETGMSLGTPHYMSPEQAMGEREITARSDVYALGAVTYEMLAGEPPFTGPTAQSIIARVMTEEPRSLMSQRRSIPAGVEAAVFRALEKVPADRFASAAEFAEALVNPAAIAASGARIAARPSRRTWILGATIAAAALLAGVALGRRTVRTPAGLTEVVRAQLNLGDSVAIRPIGNLRLAISPGGERIAFVGQDGADGSLWVREIGQSGARLLPDTKGAFAPFFSPDGAAIGFFTSMAGQTVLRVIPVAGGPARTLVEGSLPSFGGGDWGDDGHIYFTSDNRGLARVPVSGGAITRISDPDSSGDAKEHDYPDVLPGSRFALVMLWKGSIASNRIGLVDLETGRVTDLAPGSFARYVAPGFIAIGAAGGRIHVAPFDVRRGRIIGTPTVIEQDVQDEVANGTLQFAVSESGTLVYQNNVGGEVGVVWVGRDGTESPVDSALKGIFSSVALSPDGARIAIARSLAGSNQVWIKDLGTGTFSRLSSDVADADRPVWTPDGRTVGFLATRNGVRTAWTRRADGSEDTRRLVNSGLGFDEVVFDPGGRYIVLRSEGNDNEGRHLLVVERGVDTVPRVLLKSAFDTYAPTLSADGRWLAYVSHESGGPEVYVRPFPHVDSARFAISTGGGIEPVWRRDGTELFYRTRRGEMFAVPVRTGLRFEHGAPKLLFSKPGLVQQDYFRSEDVHPDGKRFLMLSSGDVVVRSLSVVLNWRSGFARLDRASR